MRDDARAIVAGLARVYAKKNELLRTLLLGESDKLFYAKSGNFDKVFEIMRNDATLIDEVGAVDYDIAKSEEALAALVGVKPRALYGILSDSGEARELLSLRAEARGAVERLLRERTDLMRMIEGASRAIRESIAELSRIDRLKRDENGDLPPLP